MASSVPTNCIRCNEDNCLHPEPTKAEITEIIVALINQGNFAEARKRHSQFWGIPSEKAIARALGMRAHAPQDDDFHKLILDITWVPQGDGVRNCKWCSECIDPEKSVVYFIFWKEFDKAYELWQENPGCIQEDHLATVLSKVEHESGNMYWHAFVRDMSTYLPHNFDAERCLVCAEIYSGQMCLDEAN